MPARKIEILDTLLRDGAQGEGIVFSLEDKIKLLRALDDIGVDYVEAGNPYSNKKDMDLFRFVKSGMKLKRSRLAAFGMTRRPNVSADSDPQVIALTECGADIISLVGKASLSQVNSVLMVSPEENLLMIEDTVKFLTDKGLTVFFDAEHFFDGYRENKDYSTDALRAACRGGAKRIILCDTNGGSMPNFVYDVIKEVSAHIYIPLGIHCHNDSGLATACTLEAVRAGVNQVQCVVNGYGERCGNANLCEVAAGIELKMGLTALPEGALTGLTALSRRVSDIANTRLDERAPYVGKSAFAHKGGMHIDGMLKSAFSFEHVNPASVGNSRRYLVSEVAGRSALMTKLKAYAPNIDRDSDTAKEILSDIKGLESAGYSFEDADGSLSLRIMGALNKRPEFFSVIDFSVESAKPSGPDNARAYVKINVGKDVEITADEGDGPINALDKALRKALTRFYPVMNDMRLTDFKVRVITNKGTESAVRVHIESTDGVNVFSTVGVSTNVIEAAFIAMTDSVDCLLMKHINNQDCAKGL